MYVCTYVFLPALQIHTHSKNQLYQYKYTYKCTRWQLLVKYVWLHIYCSIACVHDDPLELLYAYIMQEPSSDDDQSYQYFVYYGKRSGTTVKRMLVGFNTARIQMNHSSLNETVVVQLTTVRESVESSLTTPVTQCKKAA